jgi:hypothetical protein
MSKPAINNFVVKVLKAIAASIVSGGVSWMIEVGK